jgi:hypothetical protein
MVYSLPAYGPTGGANNLLAVVVPALTLIPNLFPVRHGKALHVLALRGGSKARQVGGVIEVVGNHGVADSRGDALSADFRVTMQVSGESLPVRAGIPDNSVTLLAELDQDFWDRLAILGGYPVCD